MSQLRVQYRSRLIIPLWLTMLLTLTFVSGCANMRLPAIDPTGRSLFLPQPNFTTVNGNGLLGLGLCDGTGISRLFGANAPIPAWQSPATRPPCCNQDPFNALIGRDQCASCPPPAGIAPALVTAPGVVPAPMNGYACPAQPTQLSGNTSGRRLDGIPGQLSVNPRRLVAPVGEEVILRAGICGADGYLIQKQPIEWSLSPNSVGNIIEVDQTGKPLWRQLLGRPPYKRSGEYAMGLTSSAAQVVPRGGPSQADDVWLLRGQTWASVTSAEEGVMNVTTVAPRVAGWEQRRQTSTIYWVDGRWQFPPPAVGSMTSGSQLCTQVNRSTTGAAIPGWIVRYEFLGGAPATLGSGGTSQEVRTDGRGVACVTVVPGQTQPGVSHFRTQVIKVGQSPSEPARLVVGEGNTTVTWQDGAAAPPPYVPAPYVPTPYTPTPDAHAPYTPPLIPGSPTVPANPLPPLYQTPPTQPRPGIEIPPGYQPPSRAPQAPTKPELEFRVSGPQVSQVGREINYEFQVRNTGNLPAKNAKVTSRVPDELEYLDSFPQATVRGNQLEWEIDEMSPGHIRDIQVRYGVRRGPEVNNCASLSWQGGGPLEDCLRSQLEEKSLEVSMQGPTTARVGDTITYDVAITNNGAVPLRDVVLTDEFDQGLSHRGDADRENAISRSIGSIGPFETKRFPIDFDVRSAGRWCHELIASAGGTNEVRETACVNVSAAPPLGPPPNSGFGSSGLEPPGRPGLGSQPSMKVEKFGPSVLEVGEQGLFTIQITNLGNVPLTRVRVRDEAGSGLRALQATSGHFREGNSINWVIPRIDPGQTSIVEVQMGAESPAAQVCNVVTVTSDQQAQGTDSACLRIDGRPDDPSLRRDERPDRFRETGVRESAEYIAGFRSPFDSIPALTAADELVIKITPMGASGDGDRLTYHVELTNRREVDEHQVILSIETPRGTSFVSSLNPPLVRVWRSTGDKRMVEFLPIATLRAGESQSFNIVVARETSTIGRLRAMVNTERLTQGVVATQ